MTSADLIWHLIEIILKEKNSRNNLRSEELPLFTFFIKNRKINIL